jgi:hypothetical protein
MTIATPSHLAPRLEARLFEFFLDKTGPAACVELTRGVWTRFAAQSRVTLFSLARDALLEHCRGAPAGRPPWSPGGPLGAALQGLPMDARILLELRYVDRWSTAELAALYRGSRDEAREMLRAARHALDARLAATPR